jgi:hypothetical protein
MTESPENLADRPIGRPHRDGSGNGIDDDRWDLLSALLTNVRLRGDRVASHAPRPGFTIGYDRVGALHMVEEGELDLVLPPFR